MKGEREGAVRHREPPAEPPAAPSGATGQLAAQAAVALVREELAHVLAAPTAFLRMLLGDLERGDPIDATQLEIAREEVERLQRLVTCLRATPTIRVVPAPLQLATAIDQAMRELRSGYPRPPAEVVAEVAPQIVVSVDPTALGFVIYSVATAFAARGFARLRLAAAPPAPAALACTLELFFEGAGSPESAVFPARAWAGSDSDAINFAIARRVARASNMLLRPARDASSVVNLEIPLASA